VKEGKIEIKDMKEIIQEMIDKIREKDMKEITEVKREMKKD
jgi:hypothetical protein